MDSRVCTAGMHIFNGNNSVAADNFFIYTLIDQDEEHADFIKRLRIENNLNERCGKLKIDNYIVEITVVENKKMVVVNPSAWKNAAKKVIEGVAELHGKLCKRAKSKRLILYHTFHTYNFFYLYIHVHLLD